MNTLYIHWHCPNWKVIISGPSRFWRGYTQGKGSHGYTQGRSQVILSLLLNVTHFVYLNDNDSGVTLIAFTIVLHFNICINSRYLLTNSSFLSVVFLTSAPIACKCNFPPFYEIMTDRPTDRRAHWEVTLSIIHGNAGNALKEDVQEDGLLPGGLRVW